MNFPRESLAMHRDSRASRIASQSTDEPRCFSLSDEPAGPFSHANRRNCAAEIMQRQHHRASERASEWTSGRSILLAIPSRAVKSLEPLRLDRGLCWLFAPREQDQDEGKKGEISAS